MAKDFLEVNYSHFRDVLRISGGQKVKNKSCETYLYDNNDHLLAILKAPSIDHYGRSQPPQYFVRAAA